MDNIMNNIHEFFQGQSLKRREVMKGWDLVLIWDIRKMDLVNKTLLNTYTMPRSSGQKIEYFLNFGLRPG